MDVIAGCAVERTGTGQPLVLLHGIGSRRQIWDPLLPGLVGIRDVITVDFPGFGAAASAPSAAGRFASGSVPALADAVQAVCAALAVDRPHVAGNSMGGAVALELGRRGAARSVTAFSPAGFWGRGGLAWVRGLVAGARGLAGALPPGAVRSLAATPVARPLVFGAFSAHPRRTGPDALAADAAALVAASGYADSARAFADLSWARVLGPDGDPNSGPDGERGPGALARTPVVVAWGTRDLVLPYRPQAGRARALLPGAVHLALPSCGHIPFADDPHACLAALFTASAGAGPTVG